MSCPIRIVALPSGQPLLRGGRGYSMQSIEILEVSQLVMQGPVQEPENCAVRTNSQSEHRNRRSTKTRALSQHSYAVTDVLNEGLHRITYSYRSATTGSTRVARRAGM